MTMLLSSVETCCCKTYHRVNKVNTSLGPKVPKLFGCTRTPANSTALMAKGLPGPREAKVGVAVPALTATSTGLWWLPS